MQYKSFLLLGLLLSIVLHAQVTIPFTKNHHQHKLFSQLNQHNLHRMFTQHQIETYQLLSHGYFYSLQLKINGLPYNFSVDTGSSDLLIKSAQMKGQPIKKISIQPYKNNKKISTGYLDGGLETYLGQVQVTLGEHKFNQSALIAYKASTKNYDDQGGILGLSYQGMGVNPNPTFLSTLIQNKIISTYAYGINMNFKNKSHGFITFGEKDKQFIDGELEYFKIVSQTKFIVNMKGIKINNKVSKIIEISSAILDTGNTCLSIPKALQQQVISQFNKKQNGQDTGNICFTKQESNSPIFYLLFCRVTNFTNLPQISIFIDNSQFKIQKEFYLKKCQHYENSNQSIWYCESYIQLVTSFSMLFLGDTFFNRFYTYFNLQQHKIGIAKNRQHPTFDQVLSNKSISQKQWGKIYKKQFPKDQKPSSNIFSGFFSLITNLL